MQACQQSEKERNTLHFLILGQKNKVLRIASLPYERLCLNLFDLPRNNMSV